MFQVIERGDDTLLGSFLRQGTPAKLRSPDGTTLLIYAALHGSSRSVQLLLEHGADANAANSAGVTPLVWGTGHPDKVSLLLAHGADVNARTALGNTPLMVAAARPGNSGVVQTLLARGAEAFAANRKNADALANAVSVGDSPTVDLILEHGTPEEIRASVQRVSLLSDACRRGSAEIVERLLEFAAPLNIDSANEVEQPLHIALVSQQHEIAQYLLARGADLRARSRAGNVPTIMLATYNEDGDASVVRSMLEKGVDVNVVNERGESALTWARRRGHPEMIELLLSAGAVERPDSAPTIPNREINLHAGNYQKSLRAAIESSIGLMQRSSDQFLEERKTCVSCHHQNLAGVAIGWARDRGFQVDQNSIEKMVARQRREWQGRVERTYQLEDAVPVPGRFLGWGLWGFSALGHPHDELTKAFVWYLAARQRPDGRWVDGFLRPPMGDGDVISTVLAMRALQLYPLSGSHHRWNERIERAAAWLSKVQPRYHQERVFRLLGLGWAGMAEETLRDDVDALLSTQRKDGGWSQLEHLQSDAWATGETLVALHIAGGLATTEPSYRRGAEFLLRTQFDDGAWFVKSRSYPFQPPFESGFPFGHDQWISAGGTAWATMALLLAVDARVELFAPRRGDQLPANGDSPKVAAPNPTDHPSAVTEQVDFDFSADIMPIFERSCLACHSGDAPQANFLITGRDHLLRGGDSGEPAIVPGDRTRSQLFAFISGANPDVAMPPPDERDRFPALSELEIAKIGSWIDQGAQWPAD